MPASFEKVEVQAVEVQVAFLHRENGEALNVALRYAPPHLYHPPTLALRGSPCVKSFLVASNVIFLKCVYDICLQILDILFGNLDHAGNFLN